MTQYIVRRSLQAIPLLFIISVILFLLMSNMGDPLATLGGRQPPRGGSPASGAADGPGPANFTCSMFIGWWATIGAK